MRKPLAAGLTALCAALALAQPAASQQACGIENGAEDMLAAPIVQPIASQRAVRLRVGAVLALESAAVVSRAYRSDRPVSLAGAHAYAYGSDALVGAVRTDAGERRCLRDFEGGVQGPQNGQLVACLVDTDTDGAFEAADLFRRDDVAVFGRPARFDRVAQAPLAQPVRLAEAPPFIPPGHLSAFRRIVVAALSADSVTLQIEHATLAPVGAVRQPNGRLAAPPRGTPKFQPMDGGRLAVALAEGTVAAAGGIRLRIARQGRRWTMAPLDARFPDWIGFDCGGSRLRIGRP